MVLSFLRITCIYNRETYHGSYFFLKQMMNRREKEHPHGFINSKIKKVIRFLGDFVPDFIIIW